MSYGGTSFTVTGGLGSSEDVGTLKIKATGRAGTANAGIVRNRVFTLAKAVQGQGGSSGSPGSDGDDGTDGTDGEDALSITAQPAVMAIKCDASGNPLSGQLPATAQLTVLKGSADVTSPASYSRSQSGCSSSVSSSGLVTISSLSATTGHVEVTASYGGASIRFRITFTKVNDGASGGGYVDEAEDTTLSVNNSSSYAGSAQGGLLTVDVVPGGVVFLTASAVYTASSSAASMEAKFQYRPNSSVAWKDVPGSVTQDEGTAFPSEPSFIGMSSNVAAIAGYTTMQVRWLNRRYQGSGTMSITQGNFKVVST